MSETPVHANKHHAPRDPAGPVKDESPKTSLKPKGPGSDPDGVAPAREAAKDEPKAIPNSDRHKMETAVARQSGDR